MTYTDNRKIEKTSKILNNKLHKITIFKTCDDLPWLTSTDKGFPENTVQIHSLYSWLLSEFETFSFD